MDDDVTGRGMSRWLFPVTLASVLVLGASAAAYYALRPTGEDAVEETREDIRARFALFQSVARDMPETPLASASPPSWPSAPDWPAEVPGWESGANLILIDSDVLGRSDHTISDPVEVGITQQFPLYRALHGHGPTDDYDDALESLRGFLAIRYLVVLHHVEVEQEPLVPPGASIHDGRISVTHGVVTGEAHVFDLDAGAHPLGAVRAEGTSVRDEAILVRSGWRPEEVQGTLTRRMWESFYDDVRRQLSGGATRD